MTVFLEDSFDSAHWLPNVGPDHKCRRMHGHTYRVRLEISGTVGEKTGWLIDYTEVKSAWCLIKATLDHVCLNDILPNPTCELLAEHVWNALIITLPGLSRIELRETLNCGVVYEGNK